MISPNDIATAPLDRSAKREVNPNYILAIIVGIVAALILMPIRRWFVSGSYGAGFYMDVPILTPFVGAVIGVAVRFAAGNKANWRLAFLAVGFTLFSVLGSQYLYFHYLVSQYGLEQGYGDLPLLLHPLDMIGIVIESFINSPFDIVLVLISLAIAFVVTVVSDWSSGYSAAQSASARPRVTPDVMPVEDAQDFEPKPIEILPATQSIDPSAIPTEAMGMGSPLRSYSTGTPSLVVPIILCVVGLGLWVLGIVTRDPMLPTLFFTILVLGTIAIVVGVVKLIKAITATNDQVLIYQKGLAITQKRKTATFDWKDVTKLFEYQYRYSLEGVPVYDVHDFTLILKDGRKFVLGKRFKKIVEIGELLHVKTIELILPASVEAFKRGETLDFEAIRINREGIQERKKPLSWSEVKDVRLVNGFVRVVRHGTNDYGFSGISAGKIANVRVFLIMMEDIMAGIQQKA